MIREDFHVHTTFCDGKDDAETVVRAAVAQGLTRMGFSGHSHTPHDESYCMSLASAEEYRAEIGRLRGEYSDKIKILCGLEQDYFSDTDLAPYDYAIGSVHYIFVGGEYVPIDETPQVLLGAAERHFGGDIYALAECYYAHEAGVIAKTGADIVGHFDLITKFNEGGKLFDESDRRYVDAAFGALDALLATGVPFEVNTGAITRGYRTSPYPSPFLLKRIAEKGGSVVLSSDSHSAKTLCAKFDECERLCASLGLRVESFLPKRRAQDAL